MHKIDSTNDNNKGKYYFSIFLTVMKGYSSSTTISNAEVMLVNTSIILQNIRNVIEHAQSCIRPR